jgi:DNA-binding MarR family transcriptional regulator
MTPPAHRSPGAPDATLAGNVYAVLRLLRPVLLNLMRAVERRQAGQRVTMGMRAVLERLCEGGAQTVPHLARSMMLDRQPVQRNVDELLSARLVERVANPVHRRSVLIRATAAGAVELDRIRKADMRDLRAIAAPLAPRDVEASLRVLGHLAREFATRATGEENEPPSGEVAARRRSRRPA